MFLIYYREKCSTFYEYSQLSVVAMLVTVPKRSRQSNPALGSAARFQTFLSNHGFGSFIHLQIDID